jgi:hypothetical protein
MEIYGTSSSIFGRNKKLANLQLGHQIFPQVMDIKIKSGLYISEDFFGTTFGA